MDTINSVSPNYAVVLFFAAGAIISAFLSWRFVSASAPPLRPFGIGLAFLAIAFAIWAFVVWNRSDSLALWSSIGVVAFLPSYYFFLRAATHNWLPKNRNIVLAIAGAYLAILFVLRTFVFPSEPGFSERGLFYFNAHPLVLLMYIFSFAGAFTPAVYSVAQAMSPRWLARTTLVCFNVAIVCGVVLLTSYDDDLQTYNAVLMGIAFLTLFAAHLRHRPE